MIEYIDRIKKKHNLNDSAISECLGLSRQAINKARNRGTAFEEDTLIEIAKWLEIDHSALLVQARIKHAKSPSARRAWLRVKRLMKAGNDRLFEGVR